MKTLERTSYLSQIFNNSKFSNLQTLQKNMRPHDDLALIFDHMSQTNLSVSTMSKFSDMLRSPQIESLLKTASSFDQLRVNSLALRNSISPVIDFDSLRNIIRLKNFPYPELALLFDEIEPNESSPDHSELFTNKADRSSNNLLNEIQEELSKAVDYNQLSSAAKGILIYILLVLVIPNFFDNLIVPTIFSWLEYNEAPINCATKINPANIKKINILSSMKENDSRAFLRCTTSDFLKLQTLPLMQSEVKSMLPAGSLVYVIDSSNKSWLFVQVQIGGQPINGWILRRYTKRLL